MKKLFAILLAVLLLVTPVLPVAAAEEIIASEVLHSITEEETTGTGLAFRFQVFANGVATSAGNVRDLSNATVQYNGQDVPLVKMGAIQTNDDAVGQNGDLLVKESVNDDTVLDTEAVYLQDYDENYCAFAVRIINIPEEGKKRNIYARPYCVIDVDGEEIYVYGNINVTTHYSQWCQNNPVTLPEIGTDIDLTGKKNRIRISDAFIVDRTVTLTFHNYSTGWITEETDWVKYTCYDASGKSVKSDYVYIGCIDTKKNKTKAFSFEVPDETVEVKLTSSKITYWTEWS